MTVNGVDSWLYAETTYGTASTSPTTYPNAIGKPLTSTQYNLLTPPASWQDSNDDSIEDSSVAVSHTYYYGHGQGLLSGRHTTIDALGAAHDGVATFDLGYDYNLWGGVASVWYPGLPESSCAWAPPPVIDYDSDPMGLLAVSRYFDPSTSQDILKDVDYDRATAMMTSWGTTVGTGGTYVGHEVTPDGTLARPRSVKARSVVTGTDIFDSGAFTYDAAGNITKLAGGVLATDPWAYSYDGLGRLDEAILRPDQGTDEISRSYAYGDFGNITSGTTVDASTNRLATAAGFAYDSRGNVITEPVGTWKRQLRFDPGNRLLAAWATEDGAPVDSYAFAYDPAGERVLRYRLQDDEIHEARFFIRDEGGNVLSEFLWSPQVGPFGLWTRWDDHVYLGRRPLVRITQTEDGLGGYSSSYTTLVHDHLDSTRAEVTGGDTWTGLDYWPYGELAATDYHNTTDFSAKRLFTGHEREYTAIADDALQRMDYMHARYYSPNLGRFLSVDPVGGEVGSSQSWNRYSYVMNNPIVAVDPFGQELKIMNDDAWADIQTMVGEQDVDKVSRDSETGLVTIDASSEVLESNAVLNLLNQMVTADEVYGALVSVEVPHSGGVQNLDARKQSALNFSTTDYSPTIIGLKPPQGLDGISAVHPNIATMAQGEGNALPVARYKALFHELAENYHRTTAGQYRDPAHEAAIRREEKWLSQFPAIGSYYPGHGMLNGAAVRIRFN